MATATIDEAKLKDLIKDAVIEALETRRDLVQEIVEDAMEDFAFARAVAEGLETETVSRAGVFEILDGKNENRISQKFRQRPQKYFRQKLTKKS